MGTMLKQIVSRSDENTKSRIEVGSYAVYLPQLSEFGLAVEAKEQRDEKGEFIGYAYEGDALTFLGNAVEAAVKALARNRLVPKTADLRPGQSMPADFASLVKPLEGNGGSAVLAERHSLLAKWQDFVAGLADKSDNVKRLLVLFVKTPDALVSQPQKVKDVTAGLVAEFGEALGDSLTDYQARLLGNVLAACEAVDENDW